MEYYQNESIQRLEYDHPFGLPPGQQAVHEGVGLRADDPLLAARHLLHAGGDGFGPGVQIARHDKCLEKWQRKY